jgi:hypothetical protein
MTRSSSILRGSTRLRYIGIGREHARAQVVQNLHVRVINGATGGLVLPAPNWGTKLGKLSVAA